MIIDPVVAYAIRGFLAALFLLAVLHKCADLSAFEVTLRRYVSGTVLERSPGLLRSLAFLLIGLEIVVILQLIVGGSGTIAAVLATGTLAAYGAAMLFNILRGNTLLDCGCSWGERRQPVTQGLVARNAGLAMLGAALALPVADRQLQPVDALAIAMAVCIAGLLYTSVNQMLAVAEAMREA